MDLPADSVVKNLPANAADTSLIPGSGRSPGEDNGASELVWKIPWTEESGGLSSIESQKSQWPNNSNSY